MVLHLLLSLDFGTESNGLQTNTGNPQEKGDGYSLLEILSLNIYQARKL